MLIDTHCHLDFDRFDADRDAVIERAAAAGVGCVIMPAIDLENCRAVLALAERYTAVYAAIGVHPNSTAVWQDSWLDVLRTMAKHPKVVAIGEIGLDYYWDKSPQEVQQRAFRWQLTLAAELELPVIIHNREASEDVVRLLAESSLNGLAQPGVLHSFAADWATAQQVLDMGFCLGFTGPVTYKKADELRQIAARVPINMVVVETDAPYLSPEMNGKRPSRNEPAFVVQVAERVAQERGMSTAVFARHTTENALRLFPKVKLDG